MPGTEIVALMTVIAILLALLVAGSAPPIGERYTLDGEGDGLVGDDALDL